MEIAYIISFVENRTFHVVEIPFKDGKDTKLWAELITSPDSIAESGELIHVESGQRWALSPVLKQFVYPVNF